MIKKAFITGITHKYLPKEIMNRPKMGFGIPISAWLRGELKQYVIYYLSRERMDAGGIFCPDYVVELRDNFLSSHSDNGHQIWYLLMFEMWREKWL